MDPENGLDETHIAEFKPARFPVDLGLPPSEDQKLKDAATAVRQEYRDCSQWKRLRCRKVSIFAERDRGTVYVVHVGSSVEFDWTWEGAVAFRPRSLDDDFRFSDFSYENAAYEEEIVWEGEVLEVDERNGCLFISLDNPESMPTTGSFFVRPFEFLAVLDAVFNDSAFEAIRRDLPNRLAATEGGIHPLVTTPRRVGLPHMQDWWGSIPGVFYGDHLEPVKRGRPVSRSPPFSMIPVNGFWSFRQQTGPRMRQPSRLGTPLAADPHQAWTKEGYSELAKEPLFNPSPAAVWK